MKAEAKKDVDKEFASYDTDADGFVTWDEHLVCPYALPVFTEFLSTILGLQFGLKIPHLQEIIASSLLESGPSRSHLKPKAIAPV